MSMNTMNNDFNQPRSPIIELPNEILCEIFARCVDHSSARVLMQPDTTIAPMLLCHVCAPWRAAALSLPALWAHLRFDLPLNWHGNRHPCAWDAKVLSRRLEWLRWWRRNLGGMAPYLQVELRWKRAQKYRQSRLSEATCEFLLELLSSARFISVGILYQYLVQRHRDAGYVVRVHPGAHTIVSTWVDTSEYEDPASDPLNQYLTSVLTHTRSTLRHLVIENAKFRPEDFTNPLNNWSTLTHLSMSLVFIHLNTWFSFIRSLRALQVGSFLLTFLDTTIDTYTPPSLGTLPSLASLHVSAFGKYRNSGEYPLTAVFANLQLPTLRSLSIDSREASWYDSTALTEVRAALTSAPAITKLTLGTLFLGGQTMHPDVDFHRQRKSIPDDITPLAEFAPRLEHLCFAMVRPIEEGTRSVARFVDRVFASSRWLDLESPASTVREVSFVLSDESDSERGDGVPDDADRLLLISEARKFVKDGVIVGCEEEGPVEVRRAVWGW